MFKSQNGLCRICNKPETRINYRNNKTTNLAVDHCHETKVVRGLLCSRCNTAIGLLFHDLENLENAIKYLKETK